MVQWQEFLDSFYFNHDFAVDQQIQAVAKLELDPIVADGYRHLLFDGYAALRQFIVQTDFLGTFQKTRPQRRMNLHRRIEHLLCCRFCVHAAPPD
jgi:hypothetical protein